MSRALDPGNVGLNLYVDNPNYIPTVMQNNESIQGPELGCVVTDNPFA